MFFETTILTVSLIFVVTFLIKTYSHPCRPPGPFQFPLIGNLIQILSASSKPYLAFQKLADKYGDVMQVQMGICDLVVISSVEAAQAICSQDSVIGRYQTSLMLSRTFGKGIGFFFSGGEFWKNTKRFVVRNLRNHGFGKSASMEKFIGEQSAELVERLEIEMQTHGKIDSGDCFGIPVLNVLWGMVVGETFPQDDLRLRRLLEIQDSTVKSGDFGGGISMCFPFLTKWFPGITGLTDFTQKNKMLQDFIREILDSRRSILQTQVEPTCFVDTFLLEIEKCKTAGNSEFSDEHGIVTVMDLFTAGGETSSTVLTFCLLYTVVFPIMQTKVQEEIDHVFEDRDPTVDEMEKCPYTRAVILEVMRHAIVVPFTPPRTSSVDIEHEGKIIRKNVPILVNLGAIMMSRKTWGDPEVFRPERFLTKTHQLNWKEYDKLQNFGFGHRRCPGQRLAESIMFLFYVQLCQKFNLTSLNESNPPTLEPQVGFTISAKPFSFILKKRAKSNTQQPYLF